MPFCPKCGKEASSEADYCYYCGQSLPKAQPSSEAKPTSTPQPIPASSPQQIPKESPRFSSHKNRNIAIVGITVIAVIVIVTYFGATLTTTPSNNFFPTQFQSVSITGGPDVGVYNVSFSLQNDKQVNGVANGTVIITIVDGRNNLLYQGSQTVNSNDYSKSNNVMTYSWTFPASDVKAGVPHIMNDGLAPIKFVTTNGSVILSGGSYLIAIPVLPKIWFTQFDENAGSYTNAISIGYNGGFGTIDYHYANDTFQLPIWLGANSTLVVWNITSATPGFIVVSISPLPPFNIGPTRWGYLLTIQAPNYAYNGPLTFFLNVTEGQIVIG